MGGLCEERSEKGRGGRQVEREGQQQTGTNGRMRKTAAKMGGLCEERSENGRGGRQVEREGQQQGPMEE